MVGTNFDGAIRKATIKREAARLLAQLNAADRRDVLADLLLAEDEPGETIMVTSAADPVGLGSRPKRATRRRRAVASRGRPLGAKSRKTTKADAIYGTIAAHPRMPITEIARTVYPDEEDAAHKVRAALFNLKKQGRARSLGAGQWEAVPAT